MPTGFPNIDCCRPSLNPQAEIFARSCFVWHEGRRRGACPLTQSRIVDVIFSWMCKWTRPGTGVNPETGSGMLAQFAGTEDAPDPRPLDDQP
jgi:hypothetical protein